MQYLLTTNGNENRIKLMLFLIEFCEDIFYQSKTTKLLKFVHTSKCFSEALIFASVNPQYDKEIVH